MDDDEDYRLPGLPRYLRINTIKIGMGSANTALKRDTGHFLCPDPKHPGNRAYYRDPDIPDLLVFKPKGQSDVSRIPMVGRGEAIIQQKASCFPAVALAPPPGATVIDTCAAPGNKTSHVAALMQNRGCVFAFELNARRCELLQQMMKAKGATCVRATHGSFLDASPTDPLYASVSHIMLDPSCSSSGMSRTPETDPERLRELAANQEELVLHAMSFPAVKVVVYSTCSIHDAENEEVVRAILDKAPEFELVPALPWWERRGHVLRDRVEPDALERAEHLARHVVRSSYPEDQTIGFFLAKFVRRGTDLGAKELAPSQEFTSKLEVLARARAKQGKQARKQRPAAPPAARMAPPSDDEEAPSPSQASAGKLEEAQLAGAKRGVPQWQLERDAKRQKKKQK
jgi:putative methyltransferase